MHNMFQTVPPPIIRSSRSIYRIGYFVKPLLLPTTVVEEFELILTLPRQRQVSVKFHKVPDAVYTVLSS